MSWKELSDWERVALCALYAIVNHRIGRKPHHAPIGQMLKKLHPRHRDTTLIRRALHKLRRKGLARQVKKSGEKESWTLTRTGALIAEEHCHTLWED